MSQESMAWLGLALLARQDGASIPQAIQVADGVMAELRRIGEKS